MTEDDKTEALAVREREADRLAAARDVAGAVEILSGVVAVQPDHFDGWLKLSALYRAIGNHDLALNAITRALTIDPLNFMALMSRARLLELAGNSAEAERGYVRGLAQIGDDAEIDPELEPLVTHARRIASMFTARMETAWDSALIATPGLEPDELTRLHRFKTNALRQTRTFHSEPTHYHYPGLVEREFHDRRDFPWLGELENSMSDIRAELDDLLKGEALPVPYIQHADDVPLGQWKDLNHSFDWTAFHLLQGGRRITQNANRCPKTLAALGPISQPQMPGRAPNAMFSLLKPFAHIPPHTGIANTRLVCHLPLIVPEGCWFRVGAETRQWRVGEAFVFDDTIEHEAANPTAQPRVILIFDVWHPDLSIAERSAVQALMTADEASGGSPL